MRNTPTSQPGNITHTQTDRAKLNRHRNSGTQMISKMTNKDLYRTRLELHMRQHEFVSNSHFE